MKRQFTILTMTLAMILLLSSCSETVQFETPSIGKSYIRHDDRFYFIGENESWEQQIMFVANDSDKVQYVCYDPLCLHGDDSCPLYIPGLGSYRHIVVDPNSKHTVVYVSASAMDEEKDRGVTDWLFKYDMATGKKTILIEEWDLGSINTPTLWNEHIYFESLNMYTGETAIYRMNSDASELTLMAEREKNGLYILAIENDTMYLYDDFYNVYQTDADFTDIVQLEFPGIESKKSAGCIAVKNGWLYFGIAGEPYSRTEEVPKFNWNTMKYEGDFVYQTYEIWRVRADDPSMEPEYVCDNTMFSLMMLIQDNVLFTVDKGYNHIGLQYFTVEDEEYPAHYIAYDNGIKAIDLETLEEVEIFDNSVYNIGSVCAVTDKYVIFRGQDVRDEYTMGAAEYLYVRYDRQNGTFTPLY